MRNACDEIAGHRNRPACSAAKEKGMRPRDEWPKEGMGLRAMCGIPGAEEFNTRSICSSLSNEASIELFSLRPGRRSVGGVLLNWEYTVGRDVAIAVGISAEFNTRLIRQRTAFKTSIELFLRFSAAP